MSLSGVIGRYKTGTYAVTRTAVGARVNQVYVPGATSVIQVDASIQPVIGRMLQDLPEGQHAEESRVIYTRTELKTRTPGTDPDIIVIDGEDYRVTRVEKYGAISGGHFRVWAERVVVP